MDLEGISEVKVVVTVVLVAWAITHRYQRILEFVTVVRQAAKHHCMNSK
jgi:hypothetical protein